MLVLAEPRRLWELEKENSLKKKYDVLLAALSSSYFSQTKSRARLKHKGEKNMEEKYKRRGKIQGWGKTKYNNKYKKGYRTSGKTPANELPINI